MVVGFGGILIVAIIGVVVHQLSLRRRPPQLPK